MLRNKIIGKKIRNIVILLMVIIIMVGSYTNIRRSRAENVIEIDAISIDSYGYLEDELFKIEALEIGNDQYEIKMPESINGKKINHIEKITLNEIRPEITSENGVIENATTENTATQDAIEEVQKGEETTNENTEQQEVTDTSVTVEEPVAEETPEVEMQAPVVENETEIETPVVESEPSVENKTEVDNTVIQTTPTVETPVKENESVEEKPVEENTNKEETTGIENVIGETENAEKVEIDITTNIVDNKIILTKEQIENKQINIKVIYEVAILETNEEGQYNKNLLFEKTEEERNEIEIKEETEMLYSKILKYEDEENAKLVEVKGYLPKDAELKVDEVSEEQLKEIFGDAKIDVAYDIKIVIHEVKEVLVDEKDPTKGKKDVIETIEINPEEFGEKCEVLIKDVEIQEDSQVYHVKEDNTYEQVDVKESGDENISFEATSFSIYAISLDESLTRDIGLPDDTDIEGPIIFIEGEQLSKTWEKSKSVTVTIQDELSGLASGAKVQYAWSTSNSFTSNDWKDANISQIYPEGTKSISFTVPGSEVTGVYYLWIRPVSVADTYGNSLAMSDMIVSNYGYYLDNSGPTISFTSESDETWGRGRSVTVMLSDLNVGLAEGTDIEYGWSESNTSEPSEWKAALVPPYTEGDSSTTFTATATEPSESGKHYLWVKPITLEDVLGNSTTENEISEGTFWNDNKAPVYVLPSNTSNTEFVREFSEYIDVYDEHSGVDFDADNHGFSSRYKWFTSAQSCTCDFHPTIEDGACGRALALSEANGGILATEEIIETSDSTNLTGFRVGRTYFTSLTGMEGTYYLDTKLWSVDTLYPTLGSDVYYECLGPYNIDNVPPITMGTISATINGGNTYTFDTWANKDVTITASGGADGTNGSGVDQETGTTFNIVKDDGTIIANNVYEYVLTEEGIYTISGLKTTDKVGNVLEDDSTTYTVKIDKTAPKAGTLTMKYNDSTGDSYTSGDWTNQDIYVEYNSDESDQGTYQSGIDCFWLGWDKREDDIVDGDIFDDSTIFSNEGIYLVMSTVEDIAGNVSNNAYWIRIDKTAPTITLSKNSDTTWRQNQPVGITIVDNLSGLVNTSTEYGISYYWIESLVYDGEIGRGEHFEIEPRD